MRPLFPAPLAGSPRLPLPAEDVAHRSDELDLDEITPDLLRALNLGDVDPATRTAALRSLASAGVLSNNHP